MRHSSTQSLIVKTYEHDGLVIDVSFTGEAFFNATAVAKNFDKKPAHWLEQESTKCYISELSSQTTIDENQLVRTKLGSPERGGGTWLHPKLAVAFARWCDVRFAVWCDVQIESILRKDVTLPVVADSLIAATKAFSCLATSLRRVLKLSVNASALSADQGVSKAFGFSILQLTGNTHLISETQVLHFTPTELGQRIEVSAKTFNKLLQERGLQFRENDRWIPTSAGQPYAMVLDTGKRHSDGAPVEQIKWSADVIGIVSRTPVE